MDNDVLVVKKKSKGRLSQTGWDFEQLVWQKLLYSVSPNQMTSQRKLSVLLCGRIFLFKIETGKNNLQLQRGEFKI